MFNNIGNLRVGRGLKKGNHYLCMVGCDSNIIIKVSLALCSVSGEGECAAPCQTLTSFVGGFDIIIITHSIRLAVCLETNIRDGSFFFLRVLP